MIIVPSGAGNFKFSGCAARKHHAERDEYVLITLRVMSKTLVFHSTLHYLPDCLPDYLPDCLLAHLRSPTMQFIMLTRTARTNYIRFFTLVVSYCFAFELSAEGVFPDKALEAAIRHEVFAKRYNTEPITADDVKSISRVIGKGKKIESLEGLQHCKAIMEIDLENNSIGDLGPMQDLKLLQSVNLAGNKIVSIEALAKLTGLQYLELSRNQISNIESLKPMTNMRSLYLSENKISTLEPLSEMKKIWTLHAGKNPIHDFSAIRKLVWLESLDLCETDLKDIHFLDSLTELKRLSLKKNKIKDLSTLVKACEADAAGSRRFSPFLKLDLSDNPLGDATQSKEIAKLKELGVRITLESQPKP